MLDVLQGSEYGSESVAFTQSNNRGSRVKFVGKKAEGQISKRVLQEKKARQIFRKTNISHPLILTRTLLTDVRLGCKYCVSDAKKKKLYIEHLFGNHATSFVSFRLTKYFY